jgi:type VII secretion-associated serine protease mycosin
MLSPRLLSLRMLSARMPVRAALTGLLALAFAAPSALAAGSAGASAAASVTARSRPRQDALGAESDQVRNAQSWVLNMLDVPAAWAQSRGAGVKVAVIDSGVDGDVSDLTGQVIPGPNYTGVDTPESNPDWGQHGTWMASLIAGHGHDGGSSGIVGVAPESRILSIRVITDPGDPNYKRYQREATSRVQQALATGIDYAVNHGSAVISMSIGYGGPSEAVREALQYAYQHNVVVVASAGNSGQTTSAGQHAPYSFPANYPGVLSVAAVNDAGQPAAFSSDNLSVQLAAPGVSVPAQGRDGSYWLVSGTSPACALTAGVAALVRSRYPRLSAPLVESALITSTANHPRGNYNDHVGFGTVDAEAALAAAGRLSVRTTADTGYPAASHFGGGGAAVPSPPVAKRGVGTLVLFTVLALTCLVLAGVSISGFVVLRRVRPQ